MVYSKTHHLLLIVILFSLSSSTWSQRISIRTSDLTEEVLTSKERTAELFQQWMDKHGKVYSNTKEMLMRYENFKDSMKYVIERNAMRKSPTDHILGLTAFADMTHQEFKDKYASCIKDGALGVIKHKSEAATKSPSCNPPPSLNWTEKGAVTHVKNQAACGSCWAFSTTGALEGINKIVTGKLVNVSEQQLVDCVSINFGCGGGWIHEAFNWVIENKGITSEEDYPYVAKQQACDDTKVNNVMTIDDWQQVEVSESALLCAVVEQPISVCVDASTKDFMYYYGGIYDGDCKENITHAVLLVGYGSEDGVDYWIVKNSWGDDWWGDHGYIYIRRHRDLPYGKCGIHRQAYYPIKNQQGDYLGAKTEEFDGLKEEL